MKVKPLFGRVLIKITNECPKTKTGLILQSSAQEKPLLAKVIAVYEDFVDENGKTSKAHLCEGDSVLFNKYSASEFEFEGEKLLIINEDDILAKLN